MDDQHPGSTFTPDWTRLAPVVLDALPLSICVLVAPEHFDIAVKNYFAVMG